MAREKTQFKLVLLGDCWTVKLVDNFPEWNLGNKEDVAEALECSIDKWDFVEISMDDERLVGKDFWCGGTRTCGLCELFRGGGIGGCYIGCPVVMATDSDSCTHTPYTDFYSRYSTGSPESRRSAAHDMAEFLRSLRR